MGKTAGKPCLHKVGAAANWVDVIDCRGCSPGKPAMVSAWAALLGQPVAASTDLNGVLRANRFRGRFKSGELGCHWKRATSLGDAGFQGQESFYLHPPFNLGGRILVPHLFKDNFSEKKKKVVVWSWRKVIELWSALTDAGNSYQCPARIYSRPHYTFSHLSETPPISLSFLREHLRK